MERAELRQWITELPGATCAGGYVFLCDPQWGAIEAAQARRWIEAARQGPEPELGWLCIPTGGTSGRLRFARHDEVTLGSAVVGFSRHFGFFRVHGVNVLPFHHVSGLMARLRSHATGGKCLNLDWRDLAAGQFQPVGGGEHPWCLSLVPTQLQRLLQTNGGADFLRQFTIVFIGGAPIWPQLADAAAAAGIQISLCYGMTETAAMVAAQLPADFEAGARDVGRPMPHVVIDLLHETRHNGDGTGVLRVRGGSVFRGYFPELREDQTFQTEDVAEFRAAGTLRLIGRADAVINTGGKKVWPGEVEDVLRASGAFSDIAVIGVPDAEWGERVVACHPGGLTSAGLAKAQAALSALAKYKHPKRFLAVSPWPCNAQGKVNRAALRAAAVMD